MSGDNRVVAVGIDPDGETVVAVRRADGSVEELPVPEPAPTLAPPVSRSTRLKPGGPDAVQLTVCMSCNKTDRVTPLKPRHPRGTAGSTICLGPTKVVTYLREPLT